ncbi:DgyrCDS1531 [Dimorphilus gyrociliatus]|nr:DgyrCDS1531 [Dimorphilus gyrociliatus]
MDRETFTVRSGSTFSPLNLVRKAIAIFMEQKSSCNKNHKYSLVLVHDECSWMVPFTTQHKDILNAIDEIPESKAHFGHFTFDCLFKLFKKHVILPQSPDSTVYRAIFIYGRSNCMLRSLCDSPERKEFLESANFYIDAIYIHNKLVENAENNKCEEIYRELCDLDKEGKYYIFEVSGNTTKFFTIFAKLIAHPRQRAQESIAFKKSILDITLDEEV